MPETVGHSIAVIAGDGVGPEVMRQALRVLDVLARRFRFEVKTTRFPYGTDHFLTTGQLLPDGALDQIRQHDAILLGAMGDPRAAVGMVEAGILGRLRLELDLYVNLRPIRLTNARFCPLKGKQPRHVDMVIVRENTEDAYAGIYGFAHRDGPGEVATQTMVFTRFGCERIIRFAFETAALRPRRRLTLVDKANAIRAQDLWSRTFAMVAREYSQVQTNHLYVDTACMRMVQTPEAFDVIVTTNLFGDILSDLAAALQGGLALAAGANLHPGRLGLFEPVHGSFPEAKDRNIANPLATINALGMMLESIGRSESARAMNDAVASLLRTGTIRSLEPGAHGTDQIGDMVIAELEAGEP